MPGTQFDIVCWDVKKASRQGVQEQRLDAFVTDNPARAGEARLSILAFEPRVAAEIALASVSYYVSKT